MRYYPAGKFIVVPSLSGESVSIAQTALVESPAENAAMPHAGG
jgi:hypothetical protein